MIRELRHIHGFLAVARCGSFTRAAAELRVSQPALTVQVRQLESQLGVSLFDRNKRRVALTQAGRDLVAPLERVIFDFESVIANTRDFVEHRRGIVAVGALPSVAAGLLPRAMKELAEHHPGIVVRVTDALAGRIAALVKTGDIDFGVSSHMPTDRELSYQHLITDRLCAFVPPDHPLVKKKTATLRDLVAYPLILLVKESSVRDIFDRALEKEGLKISVAHESIYMSTALGMAHAGLGVAVLPESALDVASHPELRIVPVSSPALTRKIGIIGKAGRSLSPAAVKLVDVLRQLART
jgi:LysR family transcriptional regulator, carnitine catabolism transcriptional activator